MAKLSMTFLWILLNAGLVTAGTIHTIAGGQSLELQQDGLPATDAATTFPQNVSLDAAGNILFVELETSAPSQNRCIVRAGCHDFRHWQENLQRRRGTSLAGGP
jgi:hypothetical protein